MTPPEVQFILAARRPSGADDADPVIADALARAQNDPRLSAWLASQEQFDRSISAAFDDLAVPSDLKAKILAGKRATSHAAAAQMSRTRRQWLGAAVGAAAALVTGGVVFWRPRATSVQRGAADFSSDMASYYAGFGGAGKPFDHPSATVATINNWLRTVHGFELSLPGSLSAARAIGCNVFDWHGAPTSLICLKPPAGGKIIHIFSVAQDRLRDAPGPTPAYAPIPAPNSNQPWNTALWTQDHRTYLILTHNDPSTLRRLLEAEV